jgi:hypothetical protein
MAQQTAIKLRRSQVPGSAPLATDLVLGEVALNVYDGVLYFKKSPNGIDSIVPFYPNQLTNGSYLANLDNSGNFNTGATVLTDPSTANSNYTLKVIGYNGNGSVFAVGTGTETFGVANDALNHTLSGYVPYQVTSSQATLKVVGGGSSPYVWSFNYDGTTSFPNYIFPFQAGTAGQTLQIDQYGSLNWVTASFPSVTGHAGSYLVTDGTNVSWSSIPAQNVLTNGSYNLVLNSSGNVTAPGDILVNSLSVKDNIIKTLFLYQDGNLTVKTGTIRWYASAALTMTGIVSRLTTSADDIVTVQILKNGSVIYTVNIASGITKVTTSANFSMTTDDYLTVNVTTTGSTQNPGAGLSIQFTYYFN